MYKIVLSKKASKFLDSRTEKDRTRILEALKKLSIDPFSNSLDIKKLKDKKAYKYYRLRVGTYRVIYSVFEEQVVILVTDMGNRGDIY